MSVEHRVGDLFEQTDLSAIGQGVNCIGEMGSGIAPHFKRIWGSEGMFDEYRQLCLSGQLSVGGLHAWQARSGVWIYNCASQHNKGKDARYEAIESSVALALEHAESHGVPSIGFPRIGAGIGGLKWPEVLASIEKVATDSPVRVVLVSQPGA